MMRLEELSSAFNRQREDCLHRLRLGSFGFFEASVLYYHRYLDHSEVQNEAVLNSRVELAPNELSLLSYEQLMNYFFIRGIEPSVEDAAAAGSLELVQELYDPQYHTSRDAVSLINRKGHLKFDIFLWTSDTPVSDRALTIASKNGHLDIVRYLRENGAQAKSSAIYAASQEGHLEVVRYLHETGTRITISDISVASSSGHQEVVQYLWNPHESSSQDYSSSDLSTPCEVTEDAGLSMRSLLNKLDMILSKHRNDGYSGRKGSASIREAAVAGSLERVKELYEHGYPIDTEALIIASREGHLEILKYLGRQRGISNSIVMSAACYAGHFDIIRYLWSINAPINADAIALASLKGRFWIVRNLRKSGAPIDWRAAYLAHREGYGNIVWQLWNS